jgi:hypothetical protein
VYEVILVARVPVALAELRDFKEILGPADLVEFKGSEAMLDHQVLQVLGWDLI